MIWPGPSTVSVPALALNDAPPPPACQSRSASSLIREVQSAAAAGRGRAIHPSARRSTRCLCIASRGFVFQLVLPPLLALRGTGYEPLALRIDPEPGGFKYRDAQQRLFFLAGEDQRSTGRSTEYFDDAEANRQLLFRAVGEFIGTATSGPNAKPA